MTKSLKHAIDATVRQIDAIQSEVRKNDLDWVLAFSACDRRTMQLLSAAREQRIRTAGILTNACLLLQNSIHQQPLRLTV